MKICKVVGTKRLFIGLTAPITMLASGCISIPSESEYVDIGSQTKLEVAVDPSDVVYINIPAGEVSVTGEDIGSVSALVRLRCPRDSKSCGEWASDARLESSRSGNQVRVGLNKKIKRHARVKVTLLVPKDSPLNIHMTYGELNVQGIENDVDVTMKAGDISVGMPRGAVDEVHLSARFGDTSMFMGDRSMEGRRPMLVGARIDWEDGVGEHNVDVRLRYGNVRLELYP